MRIEWFWDHTLILNEKPLPMRILTPEALLLHLSSHLELHHAGSKFLGLYDVASLLHRFGNSLDWDLVFGSATTFELGQSLRIALHRAQTVFGVSLPRSVNEQAKRLPSTWHERVARVLARPEAHPATFVFDGLEQGNWSLRLKYWRQSLFPAQVFMRERNPNLAGNSIWTYIRRLGRGVIRIPRALAAGAIIYWKIDNARTEDYLAGKMFP